jgi:hypothetical protein
MYVAILIKHQEVWEIIFDEFQQNKYIDEEPMLI